ncbi:hypothetical protein [Asticcacaulis sp. YBE204]|uniref:hypothetical protein n=1 Tax=Asticcacaulis sp. YBE204 TaxID=1282363 RepID=UPI0003C3FCB7|nr:hypothetical protein [Asticcacaulis sp. YBE204]ESQ80458.1 hypothetical protein AEYBE204_04105 [Asticcacaulis sp. YBE204]
MDWLSKRAQKPWQVGLWAFFLTLPVWSSLLGRLTKGKWWFNDFDALICGADHLRRGLSPYSLEPVCEGLKPAPYVYAPQVGKALVPLIEMFGLGGLKAGYAVVLIALIAFTFWFALIKKWPGVPLIWRVLGFGLLTGSSIASGNIGLFFHALLLIAALNIKRSIWPFLALVLIGAVIKPFLLTYLIVPMLLDRPLWQRLAISVPAAIAGIAVVGLTFATAGPLSVEWHALMSSVVVNEQTGMSWFGWMDALGITTTSPLSFIGLLVILIALSLAGIVIAELSEASDLERTVMGVTLAILLSPRVMDYDLLIVPLGMALLVMASQRLSSRAFTLTSRFYVGTSLLWLILRMADIEGVSPDKFATLSYVLFWFLLAVIWMRTDKTKIRGILNTAN